eukprot:5955873-Karenia_brevis.AAC.1
MVHKRLRTRDRSTRCSTREAHKRFAAYDDDDDGDGDNDVEHVSYDRAQHEKNNVQPGEKI